MDGQKLAQTGEGLGNGEAIRTAQHLEALGFDFVGIGEHLMRGDPPDPTDASLVVLAAAAALRLGRGLAPAADGGERAHDERREDDNTSKTPGTRNTKHRVIQIVTRR